MLLEERVQARFVEFVVLARATAPVKPFSGATVMEEVAVAPTFAVTLPGLADIVKSGDDGCVTNTVILMVWEREPLVPVTVTVKFPGEEPARLHVDDPEPPEMLLGLQLTESPVDGEAEVERLTVPAKPFWAETVALKKPASPELKVTPDGVAVRLKSGDGSLKNSVMGIAFASLDVRLGRFQFTSIVFVSE